MPRFFFSLFSSGDRKLWVVAEKKLQRTRSPSWGVGRHSKQHQCCDECCHGKHLHTERDASGMWSWILILLWANFSETIGGNVGMNGLFSRINHSPWACWIYLRREVMTKVKIHLVVEVLNQRVDRHKSSFHVDHPGWFEMFFLKLNNLPFSWAVVLHFDVSLVPRCSKL